MKGHVSREETQCVILFDKSKVKKWSGIDIWHSNCNISTYGSCLVPRQLVILFLLVMNPLKAYFELFLLYMNFILSIFVSFFLVQ